MTRIFKFGDSQIDDKSGCFTIAEIGANHMGSLDVCLEIIEAAAANGASAVKLQKRDNKNQFTAEAYQKVYNSENSFGKTYGSHREFLEFNKEQFEICRARAHELGLSFVATAFDISSLEFLLDINVDILKIASGDALNIPLLRRVSETDLPVIFSTGGCTLDDVKRAYNVLTKKNKNVAILQCTSSYPCEHSHLNLNVIKTYRENFPNAVIGFSGHESGGAMAIAAYVLGARIVEKHFTLNRSWKGTDQSFSLSPSGLSSMVKELNRTRVALGDGIKSVVPEEIEPMKKQRKGLVASKLLKAGHVIKEDDIKLKVPYSTLTGADIDDVIGKTLTIDLKQDEYFTIETLKNKLFLKVGTMDLNIWEGIYPNFDDAIGEKLGQGFEGEKWKDAIIDTLNVCINSLESNKPIPDKIKQRYVLILSSLSHMLHQHRIRTSNEESRKFVIVDFGGGLASFYFCACEVIPHFKKFVEYHVVENETLCNVASKLEILKSFNITFHKTLPAIKPDFIIAISSLQYIKKWQNLISNFIEMKPDYIFLGDIFCGHSKTFASLQNYYGSKIPCWFLNESEFRSCLETCKLSIIYEEASKGDRLGTFDRLPMDNFPDEYKMELPRHFLLCL